MDPGYQAHVFKSLITIHLLGKKLYNYVKIGPDFFLQHFKHKIVNNLAVLRIRIRDRFIPDPGPQIHI